MNNILQLLDQVKERITAYGYSDFSENITLWGGADVIISPTLAENIESWLGDQPIVISQQTLESRRRAVITKYASALSWLFYELKYIFSNSKLCLRNDAISRILRMRRNSRSNT